MSERPRTVTLEELARAAEAAGGEPRVSTEKVGLYTVTRTSYAFTEDMLPKPGAPVVVKVDSLAQLRERLEVIGRAVEAIRGEPEKYSEAVRANAWACCVALTKVHALLREIEQDSACDLGTVALAIERGAELAAEWERLKVNACLQDPVEKYEAIAGKGRKNVAEWNAQQRTEADALAVEAARTWAETAIPRSERESLSDAEIVRRYLKDGGPPRREADRLRARFGLGRKPPSKCTP